MNPFLQAPVIIIETNRLESTRNERCRQERHQSKDFPITFIIPHLSDLPAENLRPLCGATGYNTSPSHLILYDILAVFLFFFECDRRLNYTERCSFDQAGQEPV